ncbi:MULTISPECIES: DegT/DnrJ/EryC1/StrS aminotransferase family protein [Rheinheimera]|nr:MULTISPECIES: DegT/DnrJ/EryC1/StrS family aminotransferase [Rheinheimera]MCB5212653.1 DegT/DnrJ/EryC1/StrS family aminotransferase [Rheinheimera aquimaris]
MIPVYQPDLSGNEKKYVNECLDTSWISSKGRFVTEFEQCFSHFTQSKYAISVANGTVALHLALLALGVGPGDEVIVPSFTYIASVNAIQYVGATPVFVDIEAGSWQIDVELLAPLLTKNTRAIMAVHMYGHPCDMVLLQQFARQNKLFLIEDCAEAFGAYLAGQHVGTFSDIATYSFFGNKTVTTGEGGMVVTQQPELEKKIRHLKGQGLMAGREYWHDIVGYNYRMTNICAAIGLAQLERAEMFLSRKADLALYYQKQLADLPLSFQQVKPNVTHSWWMFSVLADTPEQRDDLRHHLTIEGIETRPLFNPVHKMPMYAAGELELPVTDNISCRGMNLPSWPGMSESMLMRVIDAIRNFYL